MTSNREREIRKVTLVGSIGNFLLLLFKFVAGILGHSAAMIADAVHSLSDFATDIVVLAFVHISSRPEDADHSYGHGKYETLATAIIGLALIAVGAGIMWSGGAALVRAAGGELPEAPGRLALVAAVASIAVKEVLYRYTVSRGRQLNSKAVIANAWHHRSDMLSSVGTTLGIGGAILLGERWRVLDPIAAIIVSVMIIHVAIKLLKPCWDELLERSLPPEIEREIRDIILSFPGAESPHHLRTRSIGNHYAIEVHIRMDGDLSLREVHATATCIERKLKERFGPETHVGIHMEPIRKEES